MSDTVGLTSLIGLLLSLVGSVGVFFRLMKFAEPDEVTLALVCRIIASSALVGIFILMITIVIILGEVSDLL